MTTISAPTMIVSNPTSFVCAGDTNRISVSGNSDYYTWSDNIAHPNSFYITSGYFYATVTGHSNLTGCNTQAYGVSATVRTPVIVEAYADNVCPGANSSVSAYGANTYMWNFGGTSDFYPNLYPTQDTTFWVYGFGPGGCRSDTAFTTIHIYANPTVAISAASLHACGNLPIDMYAAGNATNFYWDDGNYGDTIQHYFNQNPQEVILMGRIDSTGCENRDTLIVTWDDMPSYIGVGYNDYSYCAGDSVIDLYATNNWETYTWQPGGFVGINPPIIGYSTTTYTVTGALSNGCARSETITVTFNPLPTITTSASQDTACVGQYVTLSVTGLDNYDWIPTSYPTIDSTMTYYVTGMDNSTMCTGTDSIVVVARPRPIVVATASDSTVCIGNTITLTVTGAETYVWFGPINSTDATLTYAPLYDYNYEVRGTDMYGCENIGQVYMTTFNYPSLNTGASANPVCVGDSVSLYAYGADSYVWNDGFVGNINTVVIDSTQRFGFIGTNTGGCADTAYVDIIAKVLPVINVTASADTICQYGDVTLNASGADMYNWGFGLLFQNNWTYQVINSIENYTVIGFSTANGCYSLPITLDVAADIANIGMQLNVDAVCTDASPIVLSTGGLPYGGMYNGNGISDSTFNPAFADLGMNIINYIYYNTHGCSITASDSINVDPCVGLKTTTTLNKWKFFPNPSNGILNIVAPDNMQNDAVIEVYNTAGILVMTASYKAMQTTTLNLSPLSNGAYLVRISNDNSTEMYRIVKTD